MSRWRWRLRSTKGKCLTKKQQSMVEAYKDGQLDLVDAFLEVVGVSRENFLIKLNEEYWNLDFKLGVIRQVYQSEKIEEFPDEKTIFEKIKEELRLEKELAFILKLIKILS